MGGVGGGHVGRHCICDAIVVIGRKSLTVLEPSDGQGRRDVWRSVEDLVKGGNGIARKASNAPKKVHGEAHGDRVSA